MPYEGAFKERSEAGECQAIQREPGGEGRGTVRDSAKARESKSGPIDIADS